MRKAVAMILAVLAAAVLADLWAFGHILKDYEPGEHG
jgi:hypothetical protein